MTKVAFANSFACLFLFFKQRYLYFCLPNHSIAQRSLVRRNWQVTMPPSSACRGFSMPWTTESGASCPLHISSIRAEGAMQREELPGNFPASTQRQELARECRAGRSQAKCCSTWALEGESSAVCSLLPTVCAQRHHFSCIWVTMMCKTHLRR